MISPPTCQRLPRSRLKVVLDAVRRRKSSRKGLNVATIAAPAARSASSHCQRLGHWSRSGQACRSKVASSDGTMPCSSTRRPGLTMLLTRLLNACHHFPGFVYTSARLVEVSKRIEIEVRPRVGSKALCSGCEKPARGYDQLPQ